MGECANGEHPVQRMSQTTLIGVDWGTTHVRVYRIGAEGQCLQRRASALGIAGVRDRNFPAALEPLIGDWCVPGVPILLCGMVGSRQGWHEAPYAPCPVKLDEGARLIRVAMGQTSAWIVGGVSTVDGRGRYDVMRGEETQIAGALDGSSSVLVVAPGTHSKWARVRKGRIETFRTYLTGELYSILQRYSTLGWSDEAVGERASAEASFLQGIDEVRAEPDLLHALFSVRTRALFEGWEPAVQSAYLSGLLIGNEVTNGLRQRTAEPILLIASAALRAWYELAFAALDVREVRAVDADVATTRGLWKLSRLIPS